MDAKEIMQGLWLVVLDEEGPNQGEEPIAVYHETTDWKGIYESPPITFECNGWPVFVDTRQEAKEHLEACEALEGKNFLKVYMDDPKIDLTFAVTDVYGEEEIEKAVHEIFHVYPDEITEEGRNPFDE